MKNYLIVIILLLSINLVLGISWSGSGGGGISNSSEFWITNVGTLDDVNDTQMDGGDGDTLNIRESWLTAFGNNLWCALAGCTMDGDIDMNGNIIENVLNLFVTNNVSIDNDLSVGGNLDIEGDIEHEGHSINVSNLVPYTGAVRNVDLNDKDLIGVDKALFSSPVIISQSGNTNLWINTTASGSYARLILEHSPTEYAIDLIMHGPTFGGDDWGFPRSNLTAFVTDTPNERGAFVIGNENNNTLAFITDRIARINITGDGLVYIGENLEVGNNITIGGWFNGKFNWTSEDNWTSFDGSILTFNDSMLSTTFFNATTITVVTGTPQGPLSLIQVYDNNPYNISEVASDIEFVVNFTDIEDFNELIVRYKSGEEDEPHRLRVQIYKPDEDEWEDYGDLPESPNYHVVEFGIFDADEHIDGTGNVSVRFFQDEGVPPKTHLHNFDWVTISKGFGTPTGEEVDPLSIHKDGSTFWVGNENGNGFNSSGWDLVKANNLNITGTSYLGDLIISADNITVNNIISKDGNISFWNGTDKKMVITQDGNVGIGVADPDFKLEVQIGESDTGGIKVSDPNSMIATLGDSGSGTERGYLALYNSNVLDAVFRAGINPSYLKSGKLGIGLDDPGEALSVAGSIMIGDGAWSDGTTTGDLAVQGNVGIGTTAPTHKLNVVGDLNVTGNIIDSSGEGYAKYNFTTNNFNGTYGNFTTLGRIGIGTEIPAMALDIFNGEVNITGTAGADNTDAPDVLVITGGDGGDDGPGLVNGGKGSNIILTSGDGGKSDFGGHDGAGGDISLISGDSRDGFGTVSHGGDIYLTTGSGTGSGPFGNIILVKDGGNILIDEDNSKAFFGEVQDSSIYYDGTNMIINPREVGSGVLSILTGIQAGKITDGEIFASSSNFAFGSVGGFGGGLSIIQSSGGGSLAGGRASTNDMVYYAVINATGAGSIAWGRARADFMANGTIFSGSQGGMAIGYAENGSIISNGTRASFAIGHSFNDDLWATATNAFAFGRGFENNIADSFMVGFGSRTLIVQNSNVTIVGDLNVTGNINVTGCIEYNNAGVRALLGTCV